MFNELIDYNWDEKIEKIKYYITLLIKKLFLEYLLDL